MSKLERLLNLTIVLLNTRVPISAEHLQQTVEGYPSPGASFRRTFERDKDDLREMGIPLLIERVPMTDPPVDGYRIDPDDYYLSDLDLDPDELAALRLASLAVKLEGLGDHEALWKLGGFSEGVPAPSDSPLPGDHIASVPVEPGLIPLYEAIMKRCAVSFSYREELRTIEPWGLAFRNGRWYLAGFDQGRAGERSFRLDRIVGEVKRGEPDSFIPPDTPLAAGGKAGWQIGGEEQVTVSLRVDADRVGWAANHLGSRAMTSQLSDGSTILKMEVSNIDGFRSVVLSLLEHAEILDPPEVRADIVSWLEQIANPERALGEPNGQG